MSTPPNNHNEKFMRQFSGTQPHFAPHLNQSNLLYIAISRLNQSMNISLFEVKRSFEFFVKPLLVGRFIHLNCYKNKIFYKINNLILFCRLFCRLDDIQHMLFTNNESRSNTCFSYDQPESRSTDNIFQNLMRSTYLHKCPRGNTIV
jgi:hypothetical protein